MSEGEVLQFDFATAVLSEYDADGFLGIAVDHYGDDDGGGAPPGEAHHPLGFAARPVDPQKSGPRATVSSGATVLHFFEGQRSHTIALQDHRFKAPKLDKGGSSHYCPAVPLANATYDGRGNYKVTVPTGATLTFEIAGGPSLVFDGATIKAGGDQAQALALGAALDALLKAVLLLANGNVAQLGLPLTTAATVIAQLQAIQLTKTRTFLGT
jgi:hypothetical protein